MLRCFLKLPFAPGPNVVWASLQPIIVIAPLFASTFRLWPRTPIRSNTCRNGNDFFSKTAVGPDQRTSCPLVLFLAIPLSKPHADYLRFFVQITNSVGSSNTCDQDKSCPQLRSWNCEECDLDLINATKLAAWAAYLLVLVVSFCFNITRIER